MPGGISVASDDVLTGHGRRTRAASTRVVEGDNLGLGHRGELRDAGDRRGQDCERAHHHSLRLLAKLPDGLPPTVSRFGPSTRGTGQVPGYRGGAPALFAGGATSISFNSAWKSGRWRTAAKSSSWAKYRTLRNPWAAASRSKVTARAAYLSASDCRSPSASVSSLAASGPQRARTDAAAYRSLIGSTGTWSIS